MNVLAVVYYLCFMLIALKSMTVGSPCNLTKYFRDKEYRQKYNEWMKNKPE